MRLRSLALLSVVALCIAAVSQSAAAYSCVPSGTAQDGIPCLHGDFAGTNITFFGVSEETQTAGDPEPLFGAPTVVGNLLTFDPAAFNAAASGGGNDADHATLFMDIVGNSPTDTIMSINITEVGDASLVGSTGTGVFLQMSGTIRINATTAGAITPITVGWVGTFDTGDFFDAVSKPGTTIWTGTVSIDIAQILADNLIYDAATSVTLTYNDNIQAFSESGIISSATVQKKAVDGPAVIIEVVPEPGTVALLGLGLIGLGIRSRRRRV